MDPQDIDPGRIRTFLIGVIREGGKSKRIYGAYYEEDNGLADACHIWIGNYRGNRPTIRTRYSSYCPRALMMKGIGRWGHLTNACGRKDCVNLAHIKSIAWDEQMEWVRSHKQMVRST